MRGLQLILARLARLRARLAAPLADRRGAVAVIFALSVVPLAMVVGLATDYSFYVQVQSQLNLSADTAAMQAVRVASEVNGGGMTSAQYQSAVQTAGQQAGQQWFQAQMGNLSNASLPVGNIAVSVSYNPVGSRFTSNVSYTGTVPTHFGALFRVNSFNVAGVATAVISNSFVEVMMLLDNSSSMLIPSTAADLQRMEAATPCSTTIGTDNLHGMSGYFNNLPDNFWWSWNYTNGYGYNYNSNTPPPSNSVNGNCDSSYTGDPSGCTYAPMFQNINSSNTWLCTNNGGYKYSYNGSTYYLAQAPCAFACHSDSGNNDFFGLSRRMQPAITLRLDVVQAAVANVIQTLSDKQQPNQFSVGVYAFNTGLTTVWPASGEATSDLATAQSKTKTMTPPITLANGAPGSGSNTNFQASMQTLSQNVANAGDGSTPTTPLKDLFIITDGVNDVPTSNAIGTIGPMTSATNEQTCSTFWAKGFNVYVLYTPYLPLPSSFYESLVKPYVETSSPGSSTVAALQACARYPSHFYVASDPAAINNAMQTMLAAALNSPGRVSN